MLASKFQLLDDRGSYLFTAPRPLARSGYLVEQGREATALLYALNEAVSGCCCGPFRELFVFNDRLNPDVLETD